MNRNSMLVTAALAAVLSACGATTPGSAQTAALATSGSSSHSSQEARLVGRISGLRLDLKSFTVNGQGIDYTHATVDGALREGQLVEVEGRLVAGVLKARKVHLEDSYDDHDDSHGRHGGKGEGDRHGGDGGAGHHDGDDAHDDHGGHGNDDGPGDDKGGHGDDDGPGDDKGGHGNDDGPGDDKGGHDDDDNDDDGYEDDSGKSHPDRPGGSHR